MQRYRWYLRLRQYIWNERPVLTEKSHFPNHENSFPLEKDIHYEFSHFEWQSVQIVTWYLFTNYISVISSFFALFLTTNLRAVIYNHFKWKRRKRIPLWTLTKWLSFCLILKFGSNIRNIYDIKNINIQNIYDIRNIDIRNSYASHTLFATEFVQKLSFYKI